MNYSKQLSLAANPETEFANYWKSTKRKVHGGVYAQGKRKTARPIDTKKPIHLVLRSSRAKGSLSFWNHRSKVDATVKTHAHRLGIKIYSYSNNGNHLHISLRVISRAQFQKYLRTITGLIARIILKAKKGQPKGKFWDALAFTRVADWGRAYANLNDYIRQNILEAAGVVAYKPRRHRLVNTS